MTISPQSFWAHLLREVCVAARRARRLDRCEENLRRRRLQDRPAVVLARALDRWSRALDERDEGS